MKKKQNHLVFAICFGVGATLFCLALFLFLPQPPSSAILRDLQNVVAMLEIPSLMLAGSLSHALHLSAQYGAFLEFGMEFIQWFILGCILSLLFRRSKVPGM